MKALEILKFNVNNSIGYEKEQLEAIKELEALNNRSCEGCKYCSFSFDSAIRCDLFECYQQKALKYCGNWKPKND